MAPRREVAESCLEFLYIELVQSYERKDAECAENRDGRASRAALESIGFQVGQQLAERYTIDRARFTDHLEVIKFICKEFWNEIFRKQVDHLKTNRHRALFVLQDDRFRWLRHLSLPAEQTSNTEAVAKYLVFPCGLIKGALSSFGVNCEVTAEISEDARKPTQCSFEVRIK